MSRFALILLAVGCSGTSGESGVAPSCEQYLACTLAIAPEAYGAALELYGANSECWTTDEQTENCAAACDGALANQPSCVCSGSSCTIAYRLSPGRYVADSQELITDECPDVPSGYFYYATYSNKDLVDGHHSQLNLGVTPASPNPFEMVFGGAVESNQAHLTTPQFSNWYYEVSIPGDDRMTLMLTITGDNNCRLELRSELVYRF
jgi:hypothetical protein